MQNQKRHKATKQYPMKGFLLFFGALFTNTFFMLLPLMVGIKISQYFSLRLYTGFYFLLLFLGIFLSGQVRAKLFKQTKRKQLIRDWKDRVVAYSSIIVFVMILFLPELLKVDTTFAYFLSFISALTVAFLIWQLFGSKELRNQFRFKRAKHVDPEVQRKARRQSVVLLLSFDKLMSVPKRPFYERILAKTADIISSKFNKRGVFLLSSVLSRGHRLNKSCKTSSFWNTA
jgi:hypothetical protein